MAVRVRVGLVTTVVGIGLALGCAHSAWADGPTASTTLNGVFDYYKGDKKWATWVIVSSCDAAGNCSGEATSSLGWRDPVSRVAGGPWTIERESLDDGWVCPDGSTARAHYWYSSDTATLTGTLT